MRRSKTRLKPSKNRASKPLRSSDLGFSSSTQSAGVSDRATKADTIVETATVMANCWYITPAMPPRKATGTNTAARTSAVATTGPETSSVAFTVASRARIPDAM